MGCTLEVDAAVVDVDSYDGQQDLDEREDYDKHASYHEASLIGKLPRCGSAVDGWIHLRSRKKDSCHDYLQRACQKLQRHEFLYQHAIQFKLQMSISQAVSELRDIDNEEDVDLRLKRIQQMQETASEELRLVQRQCQYLTDLSEALRQEHDGLKKSFLFNKVNSFQTAEVRLRNLAASIANSTTITDAKKPKEGNIGVKKDNCNQSKHLSDIFNGQQTEILQQDIERLESRLSELYFSVQKCVREEELSDKVIVRIKKQARRAGKMKSHQFLQKEINRYKGWLQQNRAKLSNDLINKQVQEKVMQNLQAMKLLMNKKINNNDYIYDTFGENGEAVNKAVQVMDALADIVRNKYHRYCKKMEEMNTNAQFNKANRSNKEKANEKSACTQQDPTTVFSYFNEAQQLIQQIQSQAQNEDLSKRFDRLQSTLSSLLKSSSK